MYEQLGSDVLLNVGSGGTDVCCGVVQGGPLQPVYRGEISGRCLAVDSAAFDPRGNEVVGELGELVIRQPMPSMPVRFWGDDDGERYRSTYFDEYPGIWRFGDWILVHRARQLRGHRPLGRDAQPRRSAAGDGRVLRGGGEPGLGARLAWWCTSRTRRAAPAS